MTKNILAIAIAAAVMAPSAFAAATVYGNLNMSINSNSGIKDTTTTSNTGTVSQTNIASNSSYVGIKGDEDLGGGLKTIYQVEASVALDGETATHSTDTNFDGTTKASKVYGNDAFGELRNSFVGVAGGFGAVLAGRHDSAIKLVGRQYDLFGDTVGNNRNVLGGGNYSTFLVDGRHNNVLAYASPAFGGFKALVAYVPDSLGGLKADGSAMPIMQSANEQTSGTHTDALTAKFDYAIGSFDAALGYIGINNANGKDAYTAYRLGAGYTFGAAKVVGLYQTASLAGTSQNAYGAGASYKVGAAGTIKGQYYILEKDSSTGSTNNGNMLTVGYDHAMSKNTTAYVVYANANNAGATSALSAVTANSGSGDTVSAVANKDNSVISVGLQHKF